jgi:hypothetical protein
MPFKNLINKAIYDHIDVSFFVYRIRDLMNCDKVE